MQGFCISCCTLANPAATGLLRIGSQNMVGANLEEKHHMSEMKREQILQTL